jgi:hypothetical protein
MADFQSWSHQNLVQLVSDLQFQNAQLQADLKTVREAWKALVIKVEEQSQGGLSHDKTISPTSNR